MVRITALSASFAALVTLTLTRGIHALKCVTAPTPDGVQGYPMPSNGNDAILDLDIGRGNVPDIDMTYKVALQQGGKDHVAVSLENKPVHGKNPSWKHYVYYVKLQGSKGNLEQYYYLDGRDSCTINIQLEGVTDTSIMAANLYWLH